MTLPLNHASATGYGLWSFGCVRSCVRWVRRWTVDPSSDLYYRWLAVVTLAAVYNLTIIVGRTVLPDLQVTYRAIWITLDYVCDLVYILDVVVRFRTSKYAVLRPVSAEVLSLIYQCKVVSHMISKQEM